MPRSSCLESLLLLPAATAERSSGRPAATLLVVIVTAAIMALAIGLAPAAAGKAEAAGQLKAVVIVGPSGSLQSSNNAAGKAIADPRRRAPSAGPVRRRRRRRVSDRRARPEEHRRGVTGIAGSAEVLDDRRQPTLHHLQATSGRFRRDDRRHRSTSGVEIVEHGQHGGDVLGCEADRHGGRDPQRSLAAHEHASQVVARRFALLATEACHGPVGQDHVDDCEDMSRCDAIGEAVRAPAVVGNVAADRAGLLTRRVPARSGSRGVGAGG